MDERKEEDAGFSSENDEEGDEVEYNCVDGYIPLCQDEERGEISLGRSVSEASDDIGEANESEAKAAETSKASQEISEAQADLIKNAMAGFSLPSSVTPDWAKLMPEEVWKKQLQTGLTIRQIPPIKNCEAKKKDKS